jgi:hypothetical protein
MAAVCGAGKVPARV